MTTPVVMPQLGESVVEGTITRWLVAEGERIQKDQIIVSVATDKADSDVPAPASGVLVRILAREGVTVPTNALIAEIDVNASASATAPSVPAATQVQGATSEEPRSSPVVRRLAGEHDVDLRQVRGTGERNRVTRQDVMDYLAQQSVAPSAPPAAAAPAPVAVPAPPAPAPRPSAPAPAQALAAAPAPRAQGGNGGSFTLKPWTPSPGDEVVPFTRRRRIIADHMVFSKQVAPHVYTFAEIDMHRVSRLREAHKDAYKADGVSLTYLAFIAAATARALKEHPVLNARVLDDAYVKLRNVNLGVAVETPAGLIVPVVRNADELSVRGLARAIDGMARKARDGRIDADDLAGATFTISNPGLKGNFVGAAVISQPNVGILRTGEIVKRPVVVEVDGADTIAIHPVMFVALSYDHRIVDGVAANEFLHRITTLLEGATFEM